MRSSVSVILEDGSSRQIASDIAEISGSTYRVVVDDIKTGRIGTVSIRIGAYCVELDRDTVAQTMRQINSWEDEHGFHY